MHIRTAVLLSVVCYFFGTAAPASAQGPTSCTSEDGFIACQFTPGVNGFSTGVFDFGTDGVITFQFDTILTPFELDVSTATGPFVADEPEFPTGTTCIQYSSGNCVRYNVTGASGGPVPVRGVNFKGLITVTLNYDSDQGVHIPAFGHAPGDTTAADFTENILTTYVDPDANPCTECDPAMGGKTPGISSFAALDIPFDPSVQPATVCQYLTATPQSSTSGNNPIVEVSFKLVPQTGNCTTGPFLRDKTATLSVASFDTNNKLVFANLVNGGDANKFHFDNKNHVNIQDINTNGLPSGTYYVTVTSTIFSPVTAKFVIP